MPSVVNLIEPSRRLLAYSEAMATCEEIMTKNPVCCVPGDTAEQAAQLMQNENVGPLPVVENYDTKRLVGILTDRDLVLRAVAAGKPPSAVRVEHLMTRNPVTCHPEDELQAVFDVMMYEKVRRVPVVDHQNALVGIISQADIATRVGAAQKTGEVVEEISKHDNPKSI
jgi:CBS domain-containing protein